ncbi:GlyGly-CTERM domain protein [Vibrio cholerae]|nr:GlyGly-CTERM domain protein [Vibrio cholerae]GIA49271.1 GlyGly-CTERM domain protein [Vibrio cholerae]
MSRITFKRSILASAVLLATQTANAALYQVMEVTPDTSQSLGTSQSYDSAWGVAIQASNPDAVENCFTSSSIDIGSPDEIACTDFALAGETRIEKASTGKAVDGLSYRDEVAFGIDNEFVYVQERSDFESYCYNELLFATCDRWAESHWNRWQAEINATPIPNSIAFVGTGTTGEPLDDGVDEAQNVVINSLTESAEPIGINVKTGDVTTYRRNANAIQARLPSTISVPNVADALYTRAWKTDDNYTVGSISRQATNNEGTYFTSKPAIWKNDGSLTVELNWPSTRANTNTNNRLAQGSIRDVIESGGKLYAVGYSSFDADNNYMQASVFQLDNTSNFSNAASWTTKAVSGAESRIGGDYSVVTDVNKNLVALGSAKRAGSRPENGAAGNRLFVIEDVSASTPTANFLTGGIFFTGAGGKAGAINSYNEIVGQIDADETRENDGKPRRKRGFIYPYKISSGNPYEVTSQDTPRTKIFSYIDNQNGKTKVKAWLLDDLTNDNVATGNNNQFRVIDATDINDAGVISATALKCSGGYDTTAHNSLCSNREETVVAVKLVPIVNATSANIQQRSTEEQASERKGGSFGLWLLMVLGVLGFRRK